MDSHGDYWPDAAIPSAASAGPSPSPSENFPRRRPTHPAGQPSRLGSNCRRPLRRPAEHLGERNPPRHEISASVGSSANQWRVRVRPVQRRRTDQLRGQRRQLLSGWKDRSCGRDRSSPALRRRLPKEAALGHKSAVKLQGLLNSGELEMTKAGPDLDRYGLLLRNVAVDGNESARRWSRRPRPRHRGPHPKLVLRDSAHLQSCWLPSLREGGHVGEAETRAI